MPCLALPTLDLQPFGTSRLFDKGSAPMF